MAEQLGELTRTHVWRAPSGRCRRGSGAARSGVHRVRDLGGLLFIDVRDRAGVTQDRVRQGRRGVDGESQAPPIGVRRWRERTCSSTVRRYSQPEARDRRRSSRGPAPGDPQRGKDAAVPDRRRDAGCGRCASEIPLLGPPPPPPAEQHRPAAQGDVGRPSVFRRKRLS